MNRVKTLTLIIAISFVVTSCEYSREINTLSKATNEFWNLFDLEVQSSFSVDDSTLKHDIRCVSNYFIEANTFHLINTLWANSMDTLLDRYDSLNITYTYVDLVGGFSFGYTNEQVLELRQAISTNPIFVVLAIESLNTLDAHDVVYYESLLDDTRNAAPDFFSHQGNYWSFLAAYSTSCCDSSSKTYSEFKLLQYGVKYFTNDLVDTSYLNNMERLCQNWCSAKH